MTKQNPDLLCQNCQNFYEIMNQQGNISLDVFVICNCDHEKKQIVDQGCNIIIKSIRNGANQNIHPDYVKSIGGIAEDLLGKD